MNKNKKVKNILNSFFLFIIFISVPTSLNYTTHLKNIKKVKWPVLKTKTISSNYGYRKDPFGSNKTFFHNGIDIAAPVGEEIIALEDGVITRSEFYGGYGNTVCYKGNNTNYIYLYGHLDGNFKVKKGQKIRRGDIIGNIGPKNIANIINNPYKDSLGRDTNGFTTGPHLHFSIFDNGKSIDPYNFLTEILKKS